MPDKLYANNVAGLNDLPFIDATMLDAPLIPAWFSDMAQSNDIPLRFEGLSRSCTFFNESHAALQGMKPRELLGQCGDDLLAPETTRSSLDTNRSALEYDEIPEGETLIQTADGQPLQAPMVQRRLMSTLASAESCGKHLLSPANDLADLGRACARWHFDVEDTGGGLSALELSQVSGRSGSNVGADESGEVDGGRGLLIGCRLARAM